MKPSVKSYFKTNETQFTSEDSRKAIRFQTTIEYVDKFPEHARQLVIENSHLLFSTLQFNLHNNLTYLDLRCNQNLVDVTTLGKLINLQKLILRDNCICKLDCLKPLLKLVHLDVQNNKLLYIGFIQSLPLLSELFIEGNCICNLSSVVDHPNCQNYISLQRNPTQEDVLNYLGQCSQEQFDTELTSVLEHVKQRNSMPQYQYFTKMIKKYENEIESKVWINIFNVSNTKLKVKL
ncbi:Conserved_hypothetical protein [Hexamita inflata]|uniref:Uncharacterized protein n=1 Tax=Hexamita inflata TaxID=28002 RepID=A0AA86NN66_9EUKA|nr:Conserved hypothetical protein [Hexamita inflata]